MCFIILYLVRNVEGIVYNIIGVCVDDTSFFWCCQYKPFHGGSTEKWFYERGYGSSSQLWDDWFLRNNPHLDLSLYERANNLNRASSPQFPENLSPQKNVTVIRIFLDVITRSGWCTWNKNLGCNDFHVFKFIFLTTAGTCF